MTADLSATPPGADDRETGLGTEAERILSTIHDVSSDLALHSVLRRIVVTACHISGARYGALGVLGASPADGTITLTSFISEGIDEATVRKIGQFPHGLGILGQLIHDPRPLRLHDLTSHPNSYGFPPHHPVMHSFLGVPIAIRDEIFGNLYLTEKEGGGDFTAADERYIVGLAAAAGVAIDNARLHEKNQQLAVLEDRERIARDLHDTVIQRLFATGLSLQALTRLSEDQRVLDRLRQSIAEIDDTIREIRDLIFALNHAAYDNESLRVRILALASDAAAGLGFEPAVHFEGAVDYALPSDLAATVLAVIRELLSNVARHAGASSAALWVEVGTTILVRMEDDGSGPGTGAQGGHGLANLSKRARDLGGTFTLDARTPRGSVALWHVPRPSR